LEGWGRRPGRDEGNPGRGLGSRGLGSRGLGKGPQRSAPGTRSRARRLAPPRENRGSPFFRGAPFPVNSCEREHNPARYPLARSLLVAAFLLPRLGSSCHSDPLSHDNHKSVTPWPGVATRGRRQGTPVRYCDLNHSSRKRAQPPGWLLMTTVTRPVSLVFALSMAPSGDLLSD
jgi:hypothetical protein